MDALLKELKRFPSDAVSMKYTSRYKDHVLVTVRGEYLGIWSILKRTWVD